MRIGQHPIVSFLVGLTVAFAGVRPSRAEAPARPSIVVIVSDDAGYTDFGFTGSREIPTPRIDSIASGGVAFDAGYVTASVCSPSRAGLLTGRFQQRFGHECNLSDQPGAGTPGEEVTLAESLREAGYRTGAFGKWHLGSDVGMRPTEQGFDRFEGLLGGSRSYFADAQANGMHALRVGIERIDEPEGLYLTDWIADRAAAFVADGGEDGRPFFAYVAFTAPHTPMHATAEDLEAARRLLPPAVGERRVLIERAVLGLDRGVGKILDALERAGRSESTLVFFINDNGGATNNGSDNGPYRGMKGSKWEGGIRVPFAARWPAGFPARGRFEHPVSSLDIAATSRAAAGIEANGDGIDLLPWLRGERAGPTHRTLFWRRDVAAAARRDSWKLIRSQGNPTLLFDLMADPGERFDVSGLYPEVTRELLGELEAWEAGVQMPRWLEGEPWRTNQVWKHRAGVLGREAERRYP